jgi:hypothetical protein
MKTKAGTYLVTSVRDLKLALNAFRAIAFARDEYFFLSQQQNHHDDDHDTRQCRQRGFLEQLSYLGIRVPDKHDTAELVIPGLDDLIAFIELRCCLSCDLVPIRTREDIFGRNRQKIRRELSICGIDW